MKHLLTLLMTLLPGVASADAVPYATADGRVFLYAGGEVDGVLYPEADPQDAYTLTPDCIVTHNALGAGEWHWANGGWVVEFDGAVKLGFPRQQAPMDAPACAF